MRVLETTRVGRLVRAFPEALSVLSWYGVDPDREDLAMTLAELAASYSVDLEDMIVDLQSQMDDEEDDDDDDAEEDDETGGGFDGFDSTEDDDGWDDDGPLDDADLDFGDDDDDEDADFEDDEDDGPTPPSHRKRVA